MVRRARFHRRLRLLHGRLALANGDSVVRRIDDHQQVAFVHELIVSDGQLDDATSDLRCHRDDIGAYRTVARPKDAIC
jgi:hypothetical protein